jgi:hypothetical protein
MKHIFTVFILLFTISTQAQVGIGTSTPDASAQLEVSSTSKGLLIPQIALTGSSDATTIASPASSLLVYNTATTSDVLPGYYYNSGTTSSPVWLRLNTGCVPYTGASSEVDLGAYDLTVNGLTVGKGSGNFSSNTAIGVQALDSNNTGSNNTASGYYTLVSNIDGIGNTASGSQALAANTTGSYNTASGSQALYSNTTGSYNTASGSQALYANTIGNFNIASGYQALYSNTTGYQNIASGFEALYVNTTGNFNIASGFEALYANTTGNNNIASGYKALFSNTTGYQNTASGSQALYANTTGNFNIASGYKALFSNIDGIGNTASGYQALYSNTTGSNNTAIGGSALQTASTGVDNTAIGYNAGFNLTTGGNNTLIGFDAQPSTSTINNEITLGNSSVTTLRSQATTITSLSDRRDKTDIIPIVEGLAFLKQLNPVIFTWNTRDKAKVGIKSAGFIAQELLALQKQSNIGDNLDLVSEDNPEKLEARYGNLLPVIVKAIQEESAEKDQKIKELNERLDALEKQITQMLKK